MVYDLSNGYVTDDVTWTNFRRDPVLYSSATADKTMRC